MKPGNLIISNSVDFFIYDFQTEGFMQSGGKSFPSYLVQFFIDIGNNPDIPISGTNRRGFPILKKVKGTNSHFWLEWILERHSNFIDHIRLTLLI